VPQITARLLSLGQFLKEGMHVYGNDAMISLHLLDQTPVCNVNWVLLPKTTLIIYWLLATRHRQQDVHSIFKVDYDIMHRRLAHPSKEVLRKARSSTKDSRKSAFHGTIPYALDVHWERCLRTFPPSQSRAKNPFDKVHSNLKQFPN